MKKYYTLYCDPNISMSTVDLSAWQIVTSIQEASAVITLAQQAPLSKAPLFTPVLYLGGHSDDFEFTAPLQGEKAIQSTLSVFQTMLQRLQELPEKTILQASQDPYVFAAVFAWMRNNQIVLRLSPKLSKGYGYWLEDIAGIPTEALLDSLALSGYCHGELIDIAYPCPSCQSIQVLLRDCCPECHGIDIQSEPIIHHFICGYQANESSFLNASGYYNCPKCRSPLKHFGMDYDKPGTTAVCKTCSKYTIETTVRGRCISCHTTFDVSDDCRKRLISYKLSDAGIFALFQSDFGIYTAQHLIGAHLKLAPPEHLMLIATKLAAIERRHAFKTLVLECAISQDNKAFSNADHVRLLTELGKELAHLVRHTDTVTYHLGQFSLLLAGTSQQSGEKVVQRLTSCLSRTFTQEILQHLSFHYYPVTDRFTAEESIVSSA